MKFEEAVSGTRYGLRHNPKDFYPNSFNVETEGRRLVVVGIAKRHIRKRFRIVAVIKRAR